MLYFRPVTFGGVVISLLLTGCMTPQPQGGSARERDVSVRSSEFVTLPPANSMLGYKFAALGGINPSNPLAEETAGQILSLFGREDLIADTSDDYQATGCAPAASMRDVFAEIEDRARETSIVIINESHERSEHRGFTAEVLKRLRPLGYNTLAMEALANPLPDTPERYLPSFLRTPDLPYFEDEDGYYLSEAAFGRLGRLAKAKQYQVLPYEARHRENEETLSVDEQIALREEGQASNLSDFLRDHPGTKLIVHVGYSHAVEVPMPSGARWMAARLKDKTGIDPLTISQTACRGGSEALRFAELPADQPADGFDLVVDHPNAQFEGKRPLWRKQAGDRAVPIQANLYPSEGWRVIEARPVGENLTSIPVDRVAIRPDEDVVLMLPPGQYDLRIIDVPTPVPPSIGIE